MGSGSSTTQTERRPVTAPNVGKHTKSATAEAHGNHAHHNDVTNQRDGNNHTDDGHTAPAESASPAPTKSAQTPPKSAASGRRPPNYHTRQIPPPAPPKNFKDDIFDLDKYKHVDEYVLSAPPKLLMGSFKDLIKYLTEDETWDDTAKARAIFRWVTSIDVYSLKVESSPPSHSPLEYFLKIQNNQGNHAHLLSGLCQMAGLPCVIISGMNKSAAYEIGSKCDRKSMGAQWNAVYIEDDWRFIDAFWASACVVGKKSSEWTLVDSDGNVTQEEQDDDAEGETQHRINEFYFLPDPDKLIWTHYPDETDWQLLKKTIPMKDFENHVYVRERFYYLGMEFTPKSETKCALNAKDGEISLPFALPDDRSEHFRFKYMLYKNKGSGGDDDIGKDVLLDRFVLFEHTADHLRFAIRFPIAGKFKMDVFGLDVRESDIFDLTCTYLINCSSPQKNCLPLPDCPPIGWGFGGDAKAAGLEAKSHDGAIILSKDGKVEIKLGAHRDIRLHQLLKNTIVDEATLSKYAVIREENGDYIVDIRLPQGGEYALKLYANDEKEEGDADNVLNYLIKCQDKNVTNNPFPNVTDGMLGKKSIADHLGVKALSHPGPKIDAKDGKCRLEFSAKPDTDLVCELHSNDPNATKKMKVTPTEKNGKWIFDIDMPVEGEYSVNVFAQKKDSKRIYNVHSYLIQSGGHPEEGTGDDSNGDDNNEPIKVVTETVQTSEREVLIPCPSGHENVVACVHRRHANDPPDAQDLEYIEQDGMKIFKSTFDEYGEYMVDLYRKDENGVLKNIARYQVNRKPASELYQDDARLLMDKLQEDMEKKQQEEMAKIENESKEKAEYLRAIQRAMDLKDADMLESAIKAYVDSGNSTPDDKFLQKAKKLLELLRAKDELNAASQARDAKALAKAIERARAANYDNLLDLQIVMAVENKEPIIFTLVVVIAGLSQIGFHHANKLSSIVPESCLLIVLGVIFGGIFFGSGVSESLPQFFTPTSFFHYLLPPIILEASFSLYDKTFMDNIGSVLCFAVIGTTISCFAIGLSLFGLNSIGAMSWVDTSVVQLLVFSALIVAVDPVAVLAVFNEIGVNRCLYFLVFGESLLNDGVTVVLYNVMQAYNKITQSGGSVDAVHIVLGFLKFFIVCLGGLLIGVLVGLLSAILTKYTHKVKVVEPVAIFGMAYLAFLIAELFEFSGIICIIGCGLVQVAYAFHNITSKSKVAIKYFSKVLSTTSEIIIFLFLGLSVYKEPFVWNTGFVLWTLFLCIVFRFAITYIMSIIINKVDVYRVRKIGYDEMFIMSYGGLRGAVCFSLVALLDEKYFPQRPLFHTTTLIVILFTVFLQGATIKPLVKLLHVRRAQASDLSMYQELNEKINDHLMAGIEEVVGRAGKFQFREKFGYYDNKYFRRFLLRDFKGEEEGDLTTTYEKLVMKEHYRNLHLCGAKTMPKVNSEIRHVDSSNLLLELEKGEERNGITVEPADDVVLRQHRKGSDTVRFSVGEPTVKDFRRAMERHASTVLGQSLNPVTRFESNLQGMRKLHVVNQLRNKRSSNMRLARMNTIRKMPERALSWSESDSDLCQLREASTSQHGLKERAKTMDMTTIPNTLEGFTKKPKKVNRSRSIDTPVIEEEPEDIDPRESNPLLRNGATQDNCETAPHSEHCQLQRQDAVTENIPLGQIGKTKSQ